MKTDDTGGPSAEDKVAERLSRRYSVELERAERDYPALMRARRDPVRSTPVWRRIAVPMTAVVALVAVSLVGVGVALRPSAGPTGNNPAPAGVVRGSDGIPTSIDGQRVYRIADQSEWKNLNGSFLLGANSIVFAHSCPLQPTPLASAERDLIDMCGTHMLAASPNSDASYSGGGLIVASIGSKALDGWAGGPAIVMRAHTHDPEAAQCGTDHKAVCEAAVVVEAVIWPTVPSEFNGERVYRATDQVSFPSSGSFLLGGHVTKPSVMPPCPMQVNQTEAEQKLTPYCYVLSIDGLSVAPMSNLDEPDGEVVVARVHTHDPLAVQCAPENRASCAGSIVVELVVWRSSESAATAAPSSAASTTSPSNPASGEGSGPVPPSAPVASGPSAGSSVGPLDTNGVPTSIAGTPVYRGSNMPADATFLLGGPLTYDTSCTPTTDPTCVYWIVDGVKVRTQVALPASLPSGSLVVARLQRSKLQVDCANAPCAPIDILVVTELVWSSPAAVAPPPPVPVAS
jgi:hypothetical protein